MEGRGRGKIEPFFKKKLAVRQQCKTTVREWVSLSWQDLESWLLHTISLTRKCYTAAEDSGKTKLNEGGHSWLFYAANVNYKPRNEHTNITITNI